jgi:DNA-binding GntR family transcriptional regulator
VNELVDPLEMIELQGCKAELGYQRHWVAPVGAEAGNLLLISPQESVVWLEALYLAGGRPAIWLAAVLPKDGLIPDDKPLPAYTSLAWFAKMVSGREGTHSLTSIRAVPAGPKIGERFGTEHDFPLIQFEDLYLTDHGRPAFLSRMVFRSDIISLQMLRNSYRISDRISIW